ncbi:sensor domain-containing protein [Pseudoalteromonas xiamenensis]
MRSIARYFYFYLILFGFFSPTFAQQNYLTFPAHSQNITVDHKNIFWFIHSGQLFKSDGKHQFAYPSKQLTKIHLDNVSQLVATEQYLYFSMPEVLLRLDLYSDELEPITHHAVEQLQRLDEAHVGYLLNSNLFRTDKEKPIRVPIVEPLQRWASVDGLFFGLTKSGQLWQWSENKQAQLLQQLPWAVKQITATPLGVAVINESNEVFLVHDTRIDYLGLTGINHLSYFNKALYSVKHGALTRTELSPPFQQTISRWPSFYANTLAVGRDLWAQNRTGQWIIPTLTPYSFKASDDPTISNEPQNRVLNKGLEDFQEFKKTRSVFDFVYLRSDRWAVASNSGVYWFSAQQGSFTLFSDKTDITHLFYSGGDTIWLVSEKGAWLYNFQQQEILVELPNTIVQDVTTLTQNLSAFVSNGQLLKLNEVTNVISPIALPPEIALVTSVYAYSTDKLLVGTKTGVWSVDLSDQFNVERSRKVTDFGVRTIKASRQGVWLVGDIHIAHLHLPIGSQSFAPDAYQVDELEPPFEHFAMASYRDKVLMLKDSHLFLLGNYAPSLMREWFVSHVRFSQTNTALNNDLTGETHIWRPTDNIVTPTLADTVTIWLSGCDTCQYQVSFDNGPWKPVSSPENQIHFPAHAYSTIKIMGNDGSSTAPLYLHLKSSLASSLPWPSLVIMMLIGGVMAIAWLWSRQQLKRHNEFAQALMSHSKDAIWLADEQFKIVEVNDAYCQVTGFKPDNVIGKRPKIKTKTGRNRQLESYIAREVQSTGHWSGELWMLGANGQKMALDLAVTKLALKKREKAQFYYLGVFSDITSRKDNEEALLTLSTRDAITGLPNRNLFMESCTQAISSCNDTFPSLLVILVDIDNFRKINDLLGHQAGDFLLKDIATRLQTCLDKGYTIARFSSDEFAILVPPYLYSGMTIFFAKKLADTILKSFTRPFIHNDVETTISASCGLAVYPDNGHDTEHLLRAADSALSHAKSQGQNRFQFFDSTLHSLDPKVLTQESALLKGIENNEFILVYQPKYSGNGNELSGFEALARWPQTDGSSVPPNEFIPLAESNGTIIKLTDTLLVQVFATVQQWIRQELVFGRVAINISALHFQNPSLVDTLSQLLKEYAVPAQNIELEITESAMMDNPELALRQMRTLKSLGFTIALDDFGTGHSSLGQLKNFPIDVLKIDRSFILDIVNGEQDRNITSTIIRLAKYLNMEVVAEGVETEEQAYLLSIMGCNILQGYYFSKPLMSDAAFRLLEEIKVQQQIKLSNT